VQIIAELHETRRADRALSQEDLAREIESLGFSRAKQDGFVYVFDRCAGGASAGQPDAS
jgi:hypothetical protein